jgi:hypothetical protein
MLRRKPAPAILHLAPIDWSHWLSKRNEAVSMFGSLKTFIASLVNDAGLENRFENKDCWVATAALLIRVASVDGELSEAKRGKLHAPNCSQIRLP